MQNNFKLISPDGKLVQTKINNLIKFVSDQEETWKVYSNNHNKNYNEKAYIQWAEEYLKSGISSIIGHSIFVHK